LDEIDYLREGIGLRGYGQRDPLIEYKRESFTMFSHLVENIRATISSAIFRVSVNVSANNFEAQEQTDLTYNNDKEKMSQQENFSGSQKSEASFQNSSIQAPFKNEKKVGRNEPCPCGSGKKYKKCHGK